MIDTVKRAFLKVWNGLRVFWALTGLPLSAFDKFLKENTTGVFSFANNLLVCMAIWVFGFVFRFAAALCLSGGIAWLILHFSGYPGY